MERIAISFLMCQCSTSLRYNRDSPSFVPSQPPTANQFVSQCNSAESIVPLGDGNLIFRTEDAGGGTRVFLPSVGCDVRLDTPGNVAVLILPVPAVTPPGTTTTIFTIVCATTGLVQIYVGPNCSQARCIDAFLCGKIGDAFQFSFQAVGTNTGGNTLWISHEQI